MSADVANYTNSYLESLGVTQQFTNIDELYQYFCVERTGVGYNDSNMQNILCNNDRRNLNYTGDDTDMLSCVTLLVTAISNSFIVSPRIIWNSASENKLKRERET